MAFEILTTHHTEQDSWMRYTDWFRLTKAKCGLLGLGNTTFSDCTKRLLEQYKVRKSQIDKNRLYQPIFIPESGSSGGVKAASAGSKPRSEAAPPMDKAAQALAFLLNRKPPNMV
jgi:hypothetical protein